MATGALYNRWRGQVFADILGQEHITRTLQNQIKAGRVGHAYLFAGMRGTGKTSTARIMAKAVNCVGDTEEPPCDRCHMCRSIAEGRSLDLIEIDGASNRGINEIRELRERVGFAPSEGRYKIYVIDEVHMLTNEAFNALLKTLEEPPPRVIFILCTTAPHRLPDTVLSRCQRFDFRRASVPLLLKKLGMICEQEGIAIQPDALEFVARRATGSFRDAESLLDQLASYSDGVTEISLAQVQTILGWVSSALVTRLVRSMAAGDVPGGLRTINEAIDGGAEPRQFLREIIDQLRALLLLAIGGGDDRHTLSQQTLAEIQDLRESHSLSVDLLVRAIRLFNEAANGLRHAVRLQVPLELAFIEAALEPAQSGVPSSHPRAEESPPEPGRGEDRARQEEPEGSKAPVAAESVPTTRAREATSPVSEASPPAGPPRDQARAEETEAYPPPASFPPELDQAPPTTGAEPEGASGAVEPDGAGGPAPAPTLEQVRTLWREVLEQVRQGSRHVEAVLRGARPIAVRDGLVTIGCESPFHHGVLSADKNCELVAQALSEVLSFPCAVSCELDSAPQSETKEPPPRGSGPSDARQRLLNHPAVKELERRGGRVSGVYPVEEDQEEDASGQQG